MTVEEALRHIKKCSEQMNEHYGKMVFDEWAIVSLAKDKGRILAYMGPRNDHFLKNFANDLGTLRAEFLNPKFAVGDFEFARQAAGTGFEAFMVLGPGIYLVCNNTHSSMDEIAKNPRWLTAQVPFAELGEIFRANALKYSDNTNFFRKESLN